MSGLLQQLADWRVYVVPAVMLGFAPGFVIRLVLFLYPWDDERREELPNELYSLPRWKRPMWVAEQLETALFEGPKERTRNRRRRSAAKQVESIQQDVVAATVESLNELTRWIRDPDRPSESEEIVQRAARWFATDPDRRSERTRIYAQAVGMLVTDGDLQLQPGELFDIAIRVAVIADGSLAEAPAWVLEPPSYFFRR